jgi:endoglucanase
MSKKSTILYLTFCLVFTHITLFSQGFLRVDGQKIVNDTDDNFIIRAYNVGGWLVQEGYMLQTGEKDAEHQIRAAIQDLVGEDRTNELYDLYQDNYVRKIDIDSLAAWGFNSIRLPMHWNKLISQIDPIQFDESGFQRLNDALDWCKQNNMYVILDLHAAPGGQSKGGIADYNPAIPYLWESEVMKTATVNLWREIARRYVNEPWIGGYDLINEPAEDLGPDAPALRELYIRITDAVREIDNNHIVYIEGNWYATTFDGLTPPWDDNMVYSFHKYWNQTDQGTIQYLLNIRSTHNRPLWLGETGENSNDWFRETVELMERNNIGWAFWPHKKIESISCPVNVRKVQGYNSITNYWNGNGTRPNEDYAYTVLTNQFNAMKLENCKIQPSVYKALTHPRPTESSPFVDHQVPGIIAGSDYDLGGQGVGYFDADYKNTGSGSYNQGWSYRNDGVDIESTTDFLGNGYNVGWISSGEWLKFTANIAESGYHKFNLSFAGTTSDGLAILNLGSDLLFNIDVPNTGGSQNWEIVSVDSVFLPAGVHTFQLRFFQTSSSGYFNYNYMEINSLVVSNEDESIYPTEFNLFQNYPNPFNPTTTVKYNLPETSKIQLNLYNSLGEKVKSVLNSEQSAGSYEYTLNGSDLSSGIYFLELQGQSLVERKSFRSTIKMMLMK